VLIATGLKIRRGSSVESGPRGLESSASAIAPRPLRYLGALVNYSLGRFIVWLTMYRDMPPRRSGLANNLDAFSLMVLEAANKRPQRRRAKAANPLGGLSRGGGLGVQAGSFETTLAELRSSKRNGQSA
jgi:hypothetical protein